MVITHGHEIPGAGGVTGSQQGIGLAFYACLVDGKVKIVIVRNTRVDRPVIA
jgi:hypothetical protein